LLVDFLIQQKDLYFPSTTTIGKNGELVEAPELTLEEKQVKLRQLLQKDPPLFLERYGRALTPKELDLFVAPYQGNYEVSWHLSRLRQDSNKSAKALEKQRKNRRYQKMLQLLEDGEFFSEEEMKVRQPVLYQQYVGKYRKDPLRPSMKNKPTLTDKLMIRCELEDADEVIMRHEQQDFEEEEEDSEEAEEEEESEEDNTTANGKMEEDKMNQDPHGELERADYEEFMSIMQRRFLDGREVGFDYNVIDADASLDNLDQLDRDVQEKYFDE